MDQLENRSKVMSLQLRLKSKRVNRMKSAEVIRRERRHKLWARMRGLDDEEWFHSSSTTDCVKYMPYDDTNLSDDRKSIHALMDYINGCEELSDNSVKNYVEITKRYLSDDYNGTSCELFVDTKLMVKLRTILANDCISNTIRYSLLDLIDAILSVDDLYAYEECVLKSGLVFSVMIISDTFDIDLVIKSVSVLKTMTDAFNNVLLMAINNGYLKFLIQLLETSVTLPSKKLFEKSRPLHSEKKLVLIQEILTALIQMSGELTKTPFIGQLLNLFERLIFVKDFGVVTNVLMLLNAMVTKNPLILTVISKSLIQMMTESISRNNEAITSSVIYFWTIVCQRFPSNHVNERQFLNLMIESNVMKSFCVILWNLENKRLIKEVVDFLSIFIEKHSIGVHLLIQLNVIPVMIRATAETDSQFRQQLLNTIKQLTLRIDSIDVLNHLNGLGLTEAVVVLHSLNDPNLITAATDAYQCIQTVTQRFTQLKSLQSD